MSVQKSPDLRRKALPLFGVAALMLSLSYAAVPFYDWFCRVTGYGGTTQTAEGRSAPEILDQTITVRFDASTEKGMPWTFKPVDTKVELRIGETGLSFYEAHNPTDRPVSGTASYNVSPLSAGEFFVKIDCFCFQQQTLQPGETVMMPVTYYVDPGITRNRETEKIHTVTLSYTFFETEPDEQAALESAPGTY